MSAGDTFRDLPFDRRELPAPTPGPAKTIGILNIVFGALLMLCGVCYSFQVIMAAVFAPQMDQQMKVAEAQLQSQRKAQLDALQQAEDAAATPEERAELAAQRAALEAQPQAKMPDITKMYGFSDPTILGFYLVDSISALVLNVAMVITGAGLIGLKSWGRKGAIGVAAIKIVRLIALYGFSLAVIIPQQSKLLGEMVAELARQNPAPGAPPIGQMATMYGLMLTSTAIVLIVGGSIYPAISLWALTRPGVATACQTKVNRVD